MKGRALVVCVGLLASVAAMAASPQSDKSQSIPARSFSWKGDALSGGDAQARELLRRRVEERLASAGYHPAKQGVPDAYVALHVARRNPDDRSGGSSTLVVDIVHAASGVLIWRSFDSDLSGASLSAARFANLRTYVWKDIPAKPGVAPPYVNTDRAIRNALEAGLLFREWTVASDQETAGALVTYRLVGRGADVRAPMKATVTVEFTKPGSSEVLWKAEETGPVVKPDKVEEAAIEAVVALAKKVPAAQAAPATTPK